MQVTKRLRKNCLGHKFDKFHSYSLCDIGCDMIKHHTNPKLHNLASATNLC